MESHEMARPINFTIRHCSGGIKFRSCYICVIDTALNTHAYIYVYTYIYRQKSVYPLNSAYSTFRYRPVISIIKLHKASCITRCYCAGAGLATNRQTIFLLSQIESASAYTESYISIRRERAISEPFFRN